MGVMFGANGATDAIAKISQSAAAAAAKRIPQKSLTKGVVYPAVKKVAGYLGVKMTKDIFAKGISKAIPVIGAVISGSITLATYTPMCLKLKDYLAKLEIANPATYVIDIEPKTEDQDFES